MLESISYHFQTEVNLETVISIIENQIVKHPVYNHNLKFRSQIDSALEYLKLAHKEVVDCVNRIDSSHNPTVPD